MKIVCESCGAKYSIADERVSGKVFKIRCKRCSEVIIVRGDQSAQPAQEQAAAPSFDQTAIWHIVVEGEQAGPYSPPQLGEMLSAGTVDWDAYVWTEGFDNWLPMRDVPDLVSQISGGAPAQPPATASRAAAYRSAVHETLTGQPSMGADPFADDAAPSDGGLFGGGAAVSVSPDLFARGQAQAMASPFAAGADSGVISSGPSPRSGAEQMMTGARNENSVLFSLKNLQALATGSGASVPSPAIAPERTGYASGEGSGLIDIRALATSTGVGDNSQGAGARDELLSMGSHGGAFGTLGSPMLSHVSDEGDGSKKLLIWAGVAAVGFISLAAVAIIYIMRPTAPAPGPVGIAPPSAPAQAAAVGAAQAQPLPAAALAPSEGEQAAKAAATTGQHEHASGERSERRRRSSDSSAAKSGDEPAAAPASERTAPAPTKSGPKTLDELLDGALSGSSSKSSKPAAGDADKSSLPKTPSRDQVVSAMSGVKGAVKACGNGQGGVATVTVSVAGETGRVTNATVSGATGPVGSCVARAARGAQFPKFQQNVFKVAFPFKL